MDNIIQIDENSIKNKIYTIRGVQVMLDRDLAKLYGGCKSNKIKGASKKK